MSLGCSEILLLAILILIISGTIFFCKKASEVMAIAISKDLQILLIRANKCGTENQAE